jgi:hypothetical protein
VSDHLGIGVGRDHELRAGCSDPIDIASLQHGTGAHQYRVAEQACDDLDARQRIGRIERNFDRAKPASTITAAIEFASSPSSL